MNIRQILLLSAFFFACIANISAATVVPVEGVWALTFKPKLAITAAGSPVKQNLPALPTSDQIRFSADSEGASTGYFTASLVSGEWSQNKSAFSGVPATTVIENLIQSYLGQGGLAGFTLESATLISQTNSMKGKTKMSASGATMKGTMIHTSKWMVKVAGFAAEIPVSIKLSDPFTGVLISQ